MNITLEMILALAVVILSTAMNALHDKWITRNVGWWQWHIVKWLMFFPPLIFITLHFIDWRLWIPLVVVCWVLWRSIYTSKLSL